MQSGNSNGLTCGMCGIFREWKDLSYQVVDAGWKGRDKTWQWVCPDDGSVIGEIPFALPSDFPREPLSFDLRESGVPTYQATG